MAKNVGQRYANIFKFQEELFKKSLCQLTHQGIQGRVYPTNTRAPEREKQGFFYWPKLALPVYDKRPLTIPEQVAHLRAKGLTISDTAHAQQVLGRVGLYRFKGYLLPYKRAGGGYQAGVTFEDVEALLDFDEALRLHILDAMPLVEVGIRQAISQHMLERYGVRWYAQAELFAAPTEHFSHTDFLAKALREFHGMPDLFVGHYREKYSQAAPPPAWMVAETMTLGSWSKLFEALAENQHRNEIAQTLDLNGKTLTSWLHALTVVRNVCAHHSRLYDRQFSTIGIADNRRTRRLLLQNSFIETDPDALRLAPRLYALHRLTRALDPHTRWTADLKALLNPAPAPVLARVGFRPGWDAQPEWA